MEKSIWKVFPKRIGKIKMEVLQQKEQAHTWEKRLSVQSYKEESERFLFQWTQNLFPSKFFPATGKRAIPAVRYALFRTSGRFTIGLPILKCTVCPVLQNVHQNGMGSHHERSSAYAAERFCLRDIHRSCGNGFPLRPQ